MTNLRCLKRICSLHPANSILSYTWCQEFSSDFKIKQQLTSQLFCSNDTEQEKEFRSDSCPFFMLPNVMTQLWPWRREAVARTSAGVPCWVALLELITAIPAYLCLCFDSLCTLWASLLVVCHRRNRPRWRLNSTKLVGYGQCTCWFYDEHVDEDEYADNHNA